ncbi:MAG: hypothetical protein RLY31_3053, partial [Bacteroidota bacterium]
EPSVETEEAVALQEAAEQGPEIMIAEETPFLDGDDLTKINGVGIKVLEALHRSGIHTFAQMASTSEERFREILEENKMSRKRDTSKWAESAAILMSEV